MNRRRFPLQRRRIRSLWHPSEFSRSVSITISEKDTDYVLGNIRLIREKLAGMPVDWNYPIRDRRDPQLRAYTYTARLLCPRISPKIRKLYEA